MLHGGPDEYLSSKYATEAWLVLTGPNFIYICSFCHLVQVDMLKFAKWIDEFCPADGSFRPQFDSATLEPEIDNHCLSNMFVSNSGSLDL